MIVFPLGLRPSRFARKAPSIRIGDLLAAFIESATGDKSLLENPARKNSFKDHKLDIAPVSATHAMLAAVVGELRMATWSWICGCCWSFAWRHSLLLNIWRFKLTTPGPNMPTSGVRPGLFFARQHAPQRSWGLRLHPRYLLFVKRKTVFRNQDKANFWTFH